VTRWVSIEGDNPVTDHGVLRKLALSGAEFLPHKQGDVSFHTTEDRSFGGINSCSLVDGTFLGDSGYEKDSSDDESDSPDYSSSTPIAGKSGNAR